jgi:hypothetical protein
MNLTLTVNTTGIARGVSPGKYEIELDMAKFTSDELQMLAKLVSDDHGQHCFSQPISTPTVEAVREVISERLAYDREVAAREAENSKKLYESDLARLKNFIAAGPEGALGHDFSQSSFCRPKLPADLLAEARAVAAAGKKLAAKREAEQTAAREAIAAARIEWIRERSPLTVEKIDAGYRCDREITNLVVDAFLAELDAKNARAHMSLVGGDPDVRERTTPTDLAFMASKTLADLGSVYATKVVWLVLEDEDSEGGEEQFEAIEVTLATPWTPALGYHTIYMRSHSFAN